MSRDCQWVESNLEDYLTEHAETDVGQRISLHLETCATCRHEVEAYGRVDDLVRTYFSRQLSRAERGTAMSIRPLRLAGAVAGLGAVALALWVGFGSRQAITESPSGETGAGVALTVASSADVDVSKAVPETDILRAKPSVSEVTGDVDLAASPIPGGDLPPLEAKDFYVADAAGYVRTLGDYSGSVLVLGVFEREGQEAFGRAYEAFRTDTRLSFVGVALDTELSASPTTFPLMFNRGSSLLDTPAGGFAIVTPAGEVHRRGSLQTDPLVDVVALSLVELSGDPQ